MTDRPVRFAVVGAGIMGSNHARALKTLAGADLVAVVDADTQRAVAATHGSAARAYGHLDEVDVPIDAAIVALPTPQHLEAAQELAGRGVHLLVEKPIALNLEEADELLAAVSRSGVCLAVGHIERFNAAVCELPSLLDEPIHIEASRISPYSPRVTDGVILDLMIHDLDIVCALVGTDATVQSVSGVARCVRGSTEDLASVVVEFSTGLTAAFNTSRLGQQKVRTIEITQAESVVLADLVRQDITIHKMTRHEYLSNEGARYRQSSVIEIPFIEVRGEPLHRQLAAFVDNIRHGTSPQVDGAAGRRALELALLATDAVRSRASARRES